MTTQSNNNTANLITTGFGFLSRPRLVECAKSAKVKFKPFYSVTLKAIHGVGDEKNHTYINCNVVGKEAKEIIERLLKEFPHAATYDPENKVSVSCRFVIGDITSSMYEGKNGPGCSIAGRLIKFEYFSVNGDVWIGSKANSDDTNAGEAQAQSEEAEADAAEQAEA